jgi:peptidylprolyl isomerase
MDQAKMGDTVRVNYKGQLADGTVFDSTAEREPMQFTIGQGQVIHGFEQAVIGMAPGERKASRVPPEAAYGPYREEQVIEVPRAQIPAHLDPQIGQSLQLREPGKEPVVVQVKEMDEARVLLDANHPLAGKELAFEIEMVAIV